MTKAKGLFSASHLEYSLKKSLGKRKRFSILRFFTFSFLLFFSFYFSDDLTRPYYPLTFFLTLFLFYILVRISGKISSHIANIQSKIHSLQNENDRRKRKFNPVYKDPQFPPLDPSNHFHHDLDLTGSQGLIYTMNTCFSREGEQLFLQNMLRTKRETWQQIADRQNLVKQISQRKYFIYKFLRITDGESKKSPVRLEHIRIEKQNYSFRYQWQKFLYKPLALVFWIFVASHILTGLPLTSIAVMGNVFVFITYRNHTLKAFTRLGKIHNQIPKLRQLLLFVAGQNFHSGLPGGIDSSNKKTIHSSYRKLDKILGRVSLLQNPSLHLLLNILFLWDLWALSSIQVWCDEYGSDNLKWLDDLVVYDALLPLAVFGSRSPNFHFPEISQSSRISGNNILHPLLANGQANPLADATPGNIAIITGSNMAGKTTYIRTIGVNVLLGLCGGPVAAENMQIPYNTEIHTSIRNVDSLEEGVSFFYAEVKTLSGIIRKVKNPHTLHLVLLDEILKGTNSRERFLASKAVLDFLGKTNSIVYITTHDISLANMFGATNAIFQHFAEGIKDGKMVFDYTIRDGIVNTSNALKIMKLEGLDLDFGTNNTESSENV